MTTKEKTKREDPWANSPWDSINYGDGYDLVLYTGPENTELVYRALPQRGRFPLDYEFLYKLSVYDTSVGVIGLDGVGFEFGLAEHTKQGLELVLSKRGIFETIPSENYIGIASPGISSLPKVFQCIEDALKEK